MRPQEDIHPEHKTTEVTKDTEGGEQFPCAPQKDTRLEDQTTWTSEGME